LAHNCDWRWLAQKARVDEARPVLEQMKLAISFIQNREIFF